MKSHQSQTGSAHIVIIIVLILALLGALGFVFWQNFINKPVANQASSSQTTPTTKTDTTKPAPTFKTYTEPSYGVSFKYPSDWSVQVVSDPPLTADLATLQVTVSDSTGEKVANLGTMFQGGRTCDETVSIKLKTSDLTNLTLSGAAVPAVYLANIYNDSNGITKLIYGIAPAAYSPSSNGTSTVTCKDNASVFARVPVSGVNIKAPYSSISFESSTTYDTPADAQVFLQSSTYAQAEQTIKSLTTTAISQ